MALLSGAKEADFLFLMRETGLTKGNLSSHLAKLEESEYVNIDKQFRGKIPLTVVRLTPTGRAALQSYRKEDERAAASTISATFQLPQKQSTRSSSHFCLGPAARAGGTAHATIGRLGRQAIDALRRKRHIAKRGWAHFMAALSGRKHGRSREKCVRPYSPPSLFSPSLFSRPYSPRKRKRPAPLEAVLVLDALEFRGKRTGGPAQGCRALAPVLSGPLHGN